MDFLSTTAKNKLLFKCAPCYFKPVQAYFSQPHTSSVTPSSTTIPPSSANASSLVDSNGTVPSQSPVDNVSSHVDQPLPAASSSSAPPEIDPSSATSSVSISVHKPRQPRHLGHILRLQPTATSLVLSDSQLKKVSKYGLDGSGSTQLYSLSGALISDITNALDNLYHSSQSSARNKITDVFILVGGNDLKSSSFSLPTVEDDLSKLIGMLNLVLPEAEQHFLPFLPRPDTSPDIVSSANSILKDICGPHFTEIPTLTATSTFFKADQVHLNFKGISTICSSLSRILNIKGSRDSSLLLPPRQPDKTSTAPLATLPLLPLPPLLMPSKPPLLTQPSGLLSSPVSAAHTVTCPPTPSPLNTPPITQISSPPHHLPTSSNPLTFNTAVHPPGISTSSLNLLSQTIMLNIISGLQSQLPILISQILNNQHQAHLKMIN